MKKYYLIKSNQDCELIPEDTEVLEFGSNFNKPINNVKFPPNLREIYFGYGFNMSLKEVTFPDSLQKIKFSGFFNQELDFALPKFLKSILICDNYFYKSLEEYIFPISLDNYKRENLFNREINRDFSQLEELKLGLYYEKPLTNLILGDTKLYLTWPSETVLNSLPNNLKYLHITNLEHPVNLPPSLENLTIINNRYGKLKIPYGCSVNIKNNY